MCYHVLLCVIMFLLQSLQTVCRQCLHRSSICYVSECGLGFCYLHYLIELTNFIHSFTHSLIERTSITLLEDGLLRGASGSTPAMQTVFRYLLKVYAEYLANQKEGYSKWSAQSLKSHDIVNQSIIYCVFEVHGNGTTKAHLEMRNEDFCGSPA